MSRSSADRTGTWTRTTIVMDVAREMTKYGSVLPSVRARPSGAIRTCSIVPRSFSRTTESDVEMTEEIMPCTRSAGNRNSALRS